MIECLSEQGELPRNIEQVYRRSPVIINLAEDRAPFSFCGRGFYGRIRWRGAGSAFPKPKQQQTTQMEGSITNLG